MIASLVMVAAMSQGQCGIGHGVGGHGLFGGFRARRAARVSVRLNRRSARLNSRAHGVAAGIGCGVAPVGCSGFSKGGSPVQKDPIQKGPVQKGTDVSGIDDIPDPPAFGRVEQPAGDLIVPVQQFRTTPITTTMNKTDFRLVLAPSGDAGSPVNFPSGSQLIVL